MCSAEPRSPATSSASPSRSASASDPSSTQLAALAACALPATMLAPRLAMRRMSRALRPSMLCAKAGDRCTDGRLFSSKLTRVRQRTNVSKSPRYAERAACRPSSVDGAPRSVPLRYARSSDSALLCCGEASAGFCRSTSPLPMAASSSQHSCTPTCGLS